MAWIGLKTNSGSTGTSMASDLAKALLGDPTDVMNAAKTRSALETDEYQRRLIREQIGEHQINALKLGQERLREHDKWLARYGAIPAMEKLGVDAQTGLPVAAPAVEEPEPVVLESGGGGGVPEHLLNFDERHQPIVAAPPLRLPATGLTPGYEPPVPVGPEIGEITDSFLARRGVPGDLTETGRQGIRGEVGFPMPALPPQLAGVPPELARAPPPPPPVVGGAPDNPIVGQGQPLIDLRALLGGGDELPVPTLPEGYLTPPALLDEVPPRPASVTPEPVQTPYLPDPAPGMVPMEDLPLPVEEPAPEQALRQPAGTPFPATVDVAPTAAIEPPVPAETAPPANVPAVAATAPPSPPPSAVPSQKPVTAPDKTRITVKGADDGKQDTAEVVQTANAGPMPREQINATIKYIMLNADSPEQGMQAVQRFVGTIGAMYNPDFGPGGNERITENLASLRQGGAALGRESVLGTPAAARLAQETGDIKTTMIGDRAYTLAKTSDGRTVATLVEGQPPAKVASRFGESAEGYMRTSISDLLVNQPDPKTWSPTQKQDYAIMVDALYGTKVTVAADGTVVVVKGHLPPEVKPGDAGFNPTKVPEPTTEAGAAAPAAPAPAAAPALTGVPPDLTTSGAAVPAAAAPAATGGVKTNKYGRKLRADGYPSLGGYLVEGETPPPPIKQSVEGEEISTLKPPERTKEATEQIGKKVSYTRQALRPAAYFLSLKKGDVKITTLQDMLTKASDDTLVENWIKRYSLSADEREYYRNVIEIVKDMSHKDSGADVTASDLRTYSALYELPLDPTDKDLAIMKRSIRDTLRGEREGFNGAVPSEELRAWDGEAGKLGVDLDEEDEVAPIGASENTPSEEDIAETMRANNMTREQVLDALAKKNKGSTQ